jgi:hypothetical protein
VEKLNHENLIKARDYIFANSDDINRAWFRYNFEDENTDAFMDVLAKYQHENGGFGGLIYEFEYQGPCLVCTEIAFRYLFYLKEKPPANHPIIQKAVKYLLNRYRSDIGCWGEEMEPEVNNGAHADWMGYNPNSYPPILNINERVRKYRPNRQAALAAFIALYSELVPEDVYKDIIYYPVEKILRYYDKTSPLFTKSRTDDYYDDDIAVPYNMKCYHQFVSCLKDDALSDKLKTILLQNPTACMNLDKNIWQNDFENVACEIVGYPGSFLYPAVAGEVEESLDHLVRRMNENFVWRLNWRLGEEEAFDRLQSKYETHLTMLYLAILNRFGRFEK